MDPFHILGLPESASLREIKKAFHKLSLQCHPDKAGENSALLFQHLNAAYEMLKPGDYRPGKTYSSIQAPSSRDFDDYS
jgi:curved DNA-binding protein CbpA